MPAKNKLYESKTFPQLIEIAREEGSKDDHEVAVWIIAHTVYWKSKGYKCIREEMEK